jgi:hypothetical protein
MKYIAFLMFFLSLTFNSLGQLVRVPNRSARKYLTDIKANNASLISDARGSSSYKASVTDSPIVADWRDWKYCRIATKIRYTAKAHDSSDKAMLLIGYSNPNNNKDSLKSVFNILDSINTVDKKAFFLNAYDEWTYLHDFQFFPARNSTLAHAYFGEYSDNVVQSLKNGFLNFTPYGGMIYSELVSGYAGPLRVSFGGMIASSSLSKIDSATIKNTPSDKLDSLFNANDSINRSKSSIQNLLGGGGNAMLVLSTPFFNYHPGSVFNLDAAWFDKICFTIPSLGNEIKDYSVVNGLGLQMDMKFLFENPSLTTFGLYFSGTGTILTGNKAFYTNLGTNPAKVLAFGQLTFGIIIERFKIYFTYNVINDKSLQIQMPNCIGVNLTPF